VCVRVAPGHAHARTAQTQMDPEGSCPTTGFAVAQHLAIRAGISLSRHAGWFTVESSWAPVIISLHRSIVQEELAITDLPQASKLTAGAYFITVERKQQLMSSSLIHRIHVNSQTLGLQLPCYQRLFPFQPLFTLWLHNVTATHPSASKRSSAIQCPHATRGL